MTRSDEVVSFEVVFWVMTHRRRKPLEETSSSVLIFFGNDSIMSFILFKNQIKLLHCQSYINNILRNV